MTPSQNQRTVLITGCSEGGLGAALCRAFQQQGFYVFATLRNVNKAASLRQDDIEILPLDITSADSIRTCVDTVRAKTGGGRGRLDVLVNNAAAITAGPLLDAPLSECRHIFDVNVFGTLAVTQAFAPMVIHAQGSILNVCSSASAVKLAWQGVYSGSKSAQTSLSETLRIELAPLGVKVVTAVVGVVTTKIYENGSLNLPEGSYYGSIREKIERTAAGKLVEESSEAAEVTAENLVKDVLSGMSGETWRGGAAGTVKLFSWLLPGRLFEWMLHRERGVYELRPPITDT